MTLKGKIKMSLMVAIFCGVVALIMLAAAIFYAVNDRWDLAGLQAILFCVNVGCVFLNLRFRRELIAIADTYDSFG